MTIAACVYVPEGVVMAADSRVGWGRNINGNVEILYSSDDARKLFLFNKVGLFVHGEGFKNELSFDSVLNNFINSKIISNDNILTIAEKLKTELDLLKWNDTQVKLGGYIDNVQYILGVNSNGVVRYNQNNEYNFVCGGEIEPIRMFLLSNPIPNNSLADMSLSNAIEYAEAIVNYTCLNNSSCGGSIDILVITEDNAAFIKQKTYAP